MGQPGAVEDLSVKVIKKTVLQTLDFMKLRQVMKIFRAQGLEKSFNIVRFWESSL